MLNAINGMMLDMLAAIARKDYEDRRRRQEEGITQAKTAGRFKGSQADLQLHNKIIELRVKNKYSIRDMTSPCRANSICDLLTCLLAFLASFGKFDRWV